MAFLPPINKIIQIETKKYKAVKLKKSLNLVLSVVYGGGTLIAVGRSAKASGGLKAFTR